MAKEKKPEIIEEQVYNIHLRSGWLPKRRVARTNRSVSEVKRFVARRMHAGSVKISPKLNSMLWDSGAKNPLSKVQVKAVLDSEGVASVKLPGEITLDEEKKRFLKKKPEEKAGEKGEGAAKTGERAGKPDEKAGEKSKEEPPKETEKGKEEPAARKGEKQ